MTKTHTYISFLCVCKLKIPLNGCIEDLLANYWPNLYLGHNFSKNRSTESFNTLKSGIHELQMAISQKVFGVRRQVRPFFDTSENELPKFLGLKSIW